MSNWKPEVKVSGIWEHNGLVFATWEEAYTSARDLMCRWTAVEDCRAVESDEPVNYTYFDGALVAIKNKETES